MSVVRLYRQLLGRRLYVLVMLMPLASLSEGLGIALLLPLFASLADQQTGGGGFIGGLLDRLPLPESPLALLGLIAALFLGKAVLRFVTEGLAGIFQAKIMLRLRREFVDGYANLAYAAFSARNTGHYVNIANAQVRRAARAFRGITQTVLQLVAAAVYLAMAALTNWQFASLAAIAGVAFMLVMRTLSRYVADLSRRTATEQSSLNGNLVQVLHSLKYLIATQRAQEMSRSVQKNSQDLFGLQKRTLVARAFTSALKEPLSAIFVLGMVAIHLVWFDEPIASVVVALLLLHRATQRLFGVQVSWQQVVEFRGSIEMVQDEFAFVDSNREVRGQKRIDPLTESVDFESVRFNYNPEDGDVLRDVSINIPANQTIALVGQSGAGKSTLADLLTLLYRPTAGRLLIDGVDAAEIDPRSWRKQIGYVCQDTVIFDDTIAANIALGAEAAAPSDVRLAAEQAFAASFIEQLPEQYETVVGDRGMRLSGGQRQRLFIARELFRQPRLLILDEATSALDGESERAIQESIDALRGRMTVVVIAHRLATIRNADYIYVLEDGRVIEEGPYDELHGDTTSRFRKMVELQSL